MAYGYWKKRKPYAPSRPRPPNKADEVLAGSRKYMCGTALFEGEGSSVGYLQSGVYLDQAEFDRVVDEFLAEINKISKRRWRVVEKSLYDRRAKEDGE